MNLQQNYNTNLKKQLQAELGEKNVMAIPRLVKIVVNVGVKEALGDKKVLEHVSQQLVAITGQKPVINRAKKSIAAFKLREGEPIGVSVTLRAGRMYDFLERVINVVFPRVRDFRGMSLSGFDGQGNYTFGLREQIVFTEIDYDKIDRIRGLEVTLVTTAGNKERGEKLLRILGFPFIRVK